MRPLLVLALVFAACGPLLAQHLGARQQWQAHADAAAAVDARLDRRVEIEIIGRSAAQALALVSAMTGVSLSIAPEHLDTVGERKLTIIAQGCTLKAIMTQVPVALQECHWDVGDSGEHRVYLLHRNAGVDYVALKNEMSGRMREQHDDAIPRARAARVGEAARGLRLSPEKLADLEQSDYFLAIALRDPATRSSLEAFLSLPDHQRQQFFDTGELRIAFSEAPGSVREAAVSQIESLCGTAIEAARRHPENLPPGEEFDEGAAREWLAALIENDVPGSTLVYRDVNAAVGTILQAGGGETQLRTGAGILLVVETAAGPIAEHAVVPPRYPGVGSASSFMPLLMPIADYDEAAAERIHAETVRKGEQALLSKGTGREDAATADAFPAELRVPFALEGPTVQLAQLQGRIARETGLSIISDYATGRSFPLPPGQVGREQPLGRALNLLEQSAVSSGFQWKLAGDCLVFYHTLWPFWAVREIPDPLAASCREKLRTDGRLDLEDLAVFYQALAELPQARERGLSWPEDLRMSGLPVAPGDRWALLLFGMLAPEQREKACSPEWLTYSDMNVRQRRLAGAVAAEPPMEIGAERAAELRFQIAERGGSEDGRRFTLYQLLLEAPGEPPAVRRASVRLPEIRPAP